MTAVSIGITVHAQPASLSATLTALEGHTGREVDIVLLPDGPDLETRTALERLPGFRQLATPEPAGGASCFNRLIAAEQSDVYILLESGAIPGPGWLDPLLAALADPANGLAGPSTNRSWNEQRLFPAARGILADVSATARVARQRYAGQYRTLEPLYSLADFCYAVRREVVEKIGAADEGYGLGPCWEMDYNIRAARAGYKGVWACSSYVYRSPFTARRQSEEAARFEASKHRYQDKFCALRLRGERGAYEPHCRGDACEHFAPISSVQLHIELPAGFRLDSDGAPTVPAPQPARSTPKPVRVTPAQPQGPASTLPLVSCLMPTRGRPDFVRQAIEYFLRQDYAERELVIVHESEADLPRSLPADPRIVTVVSAPGSSIGAKRNLGIGRAHGAIMAQWDDDDWYSDGRLTRQVAPILRGEADITGLEAGVFFDLDAWTFWRLTPELHRRLFVSDVHGGTLVYRRHVWDRLSRYPDASLAEDALFLRTAQRGGARLLKLPNEGSFIYLRHGANAWSFPLGRYLDPHGWLRCDEPPLPDRDRTFYEDMRQRTASTYGTGSVAQPLVTCIMPTYNRRHYVPQAIRYFMRQDYPNRELLILDDGEERVADLAPSDARVRYVALPARMILGAKRNHACELAAGDIILHWDDDDWMAPHRISYQVKVLLEARADVSGAPRQIYYDAVRDRAWLYEYRRGTSQADHRYVAGNTLCYRKSFWRGNPFPEIQVGEDTRFLWGNRARNMIATPESDYYIGLIHTSNTSPKSLGPPYWRAYSAERVHDLMGEDLSFYRERNAVAVTGS